MWIKKILYASLRALGVYALSQWRHRKQAVILCYHGVVQGGEDNYSNRNAVTAETFERQMAYVARHYHVLPLPELVRRLIAKEPLPDYALALTFDDGFRNNVTVAAPILEKYKLPATVFLTTAFIDSEKLGLWTERVDWLLQCADKPAVTVEIDGNARELTLSTARDRIIASDVIRAHLKALSPKERESSIMQLAEKIGATRRIDGQLEERYAFMTWKEARGLLTKRITLGSHTHTHAIMSTLSLAEAHFELSMSQKLIEAELDGKCELFCYPNGGPRDFTTRDKELLHKLGYAAAVTLIPGFNDHRTDRYELRRFNIVRSNDFNFFLAKLSGVWGGVKRVFKNI
jgi:peptidoglycan/xylan/chitin deacetylase (PgdA/CDA1 family)